MKARDFIEISNREEGRFRKTTRPCPLPPSIIEQKVERLTPQKYQYYDGNSAVVGSPFNETGSRNNDFTSKSFVSNSIFYEHHKPGYAKSDMYLTMNNLHQSRSVERQSQRKQLRREGDTPTKIESFRPKSKIKQTKSHYSNRSTSKINKSKSPIKDRSRSRYSRNGSKHMVTPPRGKLHLSANKQRELNLSASRSDNYNILTGQKRNETKEVHINSEFGSPKAAGVVKEREERIKTPNYDIRKAPGMHKKILKDLKDNDCMWLNHLAREELVRKVREDRIDNMQDYILRNPQKYTENVTCQEISDSEMQKKGILNEMSGDPILQVHCLKQKKRDKLKKYLYRQNPRKGGHEYNKWLLQNSKGASLTMTPDKTFGRVIPIDKEQYHRDLMNQIQMDKVRKEGEKTLGFHERQKNQLCYERKMKTLEKIINTSRADRRKRYINQVCKKS